jgi:hypothetical protein
VDGVIVVSGVGIRGELVNTITNDRLGRDSLIDNPYLRVNLGLDYNVSRIISDWDLFMMVQYAFDTGYDSDNISLRHFYEKMLLFRMELKISDWLSLEVRGAENLDRIDFMLQPEIAWTRLDNLKISVGADLFEGKQTGFFGGYNRNDRLRVKVKYSY